jgi:drug/metabolite transporter (DMT)-like permease
MGGILLLYKVLAAGPMGVMSPVTAVVSTIVPVAAGLLRGERPGLQAYLGMALAVLAIVLVSVEPRRDDDASHQVVRPRILALAVLSGLFIGGYLTLIALAPADSGVWPVLISRIASSVVIVGIAVARFRRATFARSVLWAALVIGVLDSFANATYRLASQEGLLAVVAVLVALYPAATVLLARYYLHERLRPVQQVGMVTALAAAVLLALPT